jgi:hypothetical protein
MKTRIKGQYFVLIAMATILLIGCMSAYALGNQSDYGIDGYAINAQGLTYGSAASASLGDLPDLISAYDTNGRLGYIFTKEILAIIPNSYEDKWKMASDKNNWNSIHLYEIDGRTIVGEFIVGPAALAYFDSTVGDRAKSLPSSFPVNQNGQTYGSARYTTPLTEPDLISVTGNDGVVGYVYSEEFYKPLPEGVFTIPVFAIDGKTVTGKFEIVNADIEIK